MESHWLSGVDNGPQFDSEEFEKFSANYNFEHSTSSPRYPQSNGFVERGVKTVKNLLKKSQDPYLTLLNYRATPLSWCGRSPTELLMGMKGEDDNQWDSMMTETILHCLNNSVWGSAGELTDFRVPWKIVNLQQVVSSVHEWKDQHLQCAMHVEVMVSELEALLQVLGVLHKLYSLSPYLLPVLRFQATKQTHGFALDTWGYPSGLLSAAGTNYTKASQT